MRESSTNSDKAEEVIKKQKREDRARMLIDAYYAELDESSQVPFIRRRRENANVIENDDKQPIRKISKPLLKLFGHEK